MAGIEVRCSYGEDDLIRSQYGQEIETARGIAGSWKTVAESEGFVE